MKLTNLFSQKSYKFKVYFYLDDGFVCLEYNIIHHTNISKHIFYVSDSNENFGDRISFLPIYILSSSNVYYIYTLSSSNVYIYTHCFTHSYAHVQNELKSLLEVTISIHFLFVYECV